MLPELNNVYKIVQRTTVKKSNHPTPNDPMVEYNNIFLKLITVSKIVPNKRYEKTTRNKFPQNKIEQVTQMNSFSNSNLNQVENNYFLNLPNFQLSNNNINRNFTRIPLSLSIKKVINPLFHDNKISLGKNNYDKNDASKKMLKRTLANLEECILNKSGNIVEKNESFFPNKNKFNKRLLVENSLNLYKSANIKVNKFDDSSERNFIKNENVKPEEIKEKIIEYVENNINSNIEINKTENNNNYKTENNKNNNKTDNNNYNNSKNDILNYKMNNTCKTKRSFNFINREKIKNNLEENKNSLLNTISNMTKKIIENPKKNNQKEQKKIKIVVPEKTIPHQIIETLKNKFIKREEYEKRLNYKLIEFPLNQNINNPTNTFYYYINKMYSNQLTEYFTHRKNWENVINQNSPEIPTINFYWKYYSNKVHFKQFKHDPNLPMKKLKCVNLFERNYEIGNKKNLFINLIQYCDKVNLNVFNFIPFTIIIHISRINESFDSLNEIFQLIQNNNFNNSERDFITNKKYFDLFGFDKNFSETKNTPIFIDKHFFSEKNYWILKPTDLYKGMCIEISNNYDDIVKHCKKMFKGVDKKFLIEDFDEESENNEEEKDNNLNNNNSLNNNNQNPTIENIEEEEKKKKKTNSMYISHSIVLQKYLDNPLLYKKRKFDLRCYVLVDSNLNVFYCREGHLKGSSLKYDLKNTNKFIHITNHSLQKKSNKFEKYEFGNEMSYNDFKLFLQSENIPLMKYDELINDMKYLIKISMNSVGKKFLKNNNVLCFEVFGYDFIIDNDFKPWILEINSNPGLGISSPVIEKLVPRMFDDALRLTIDKIFNTVYDDSCFDENNNLYISKYKLDGFSDHENVFEFLCNINN